jgi:malate/lactate dehydrogenase
MAVYCDGSYGIEKGIYFSFPIQCLGNFEYEIAKGIKLSKYAREKLRATQKELISERNESEKTVSPKL